MTADDVATLVAATLFLLVPAVILWLKGKRLWATLGLITMWHWIPVFRLAKPGSWWSTRFYDDAKLQRAQVRFGSREPYIGYSPPDALEEFSADDIVLEDKVTRKAWEKAQRRKT